jgi:hypothetical protein
MNIEHLIRYLKVVLLFHIDGILRLGIVTTGSVRGQGNLLQLGPPRQHRCWDQLSPVGKKAGY